MLKVGQQVRINPTSAMAREWKTLPEMRGTVVCAYRILGKYAPYRERIDVRVGGKMMMWGRPESEFEPIGD